MLKFCDSIKCNMFGLPAAMNVAPATSGDKRNSVNNNNQDYYYIYVKKVDVQNSILGTKFHQKVNEEHRQSNYFVYT